MGSQSILKIGGVWLVNHGVSDLVSGFGISLKMHQSVAPLVVSVSWVALVMLVVLVTWAEGLGFLFGQEGLSLELLLSSSSDKRGDHKWVFGFGLSLVTSEMFTKGLAFFFSRG